MGFKVQKNKEWESALTADFFIDLSGGQSAHSHISCNIERDTRRLPGEKQLLSGPVRIVILLFNFLFFHSISK